MGAKACVSFGKRAMGSIVEAYLWFGFQLSTRLGMEEETNYSTL